MQSASLHLTVNNKPGVMSRICALYAQYGYNLDGVLTTRNSDGATSSVWLLVKEDSKMHLIVEQMQEISGILNVRLELAPCP